MNSLRLIFGAALLLTGGINCLSQTISWTGGGDGSSWSDANNWMGAQMPGPGNNVVITNIGGSSVVISSSVSILGILSSNSLTISSGSLTVTAGASFLRGPFAAGSGTVVSANGAGTSLSATGTVNVDGANFSSTGGASITLPTLETYSGGCGQFSWLANGAGSVLNFPNLTNTTQPYCGYGGYLQAQAGGQILLPDVVSIDEGGDPQTIQADGMGSLISLPSLKTVSGAYAVTFESSNGGTNWVPQLQGGPNVYLILNTNAVLPVDHIQKVVGITATGVLTNFLSLTNIDGGSIALSAGASLTFPALQNYDGGCGSYSWTSTGSNTVLSLLVLTNVAQAFCGYGGQILASAGGQILATNLTNFVELGDPVNIKADGSNSLVNFSNLRTVSGNYTVTFEASAGGTNWVPQLLGGLNVTITLNPGGTIPVNQIQQLNGITDAGVAANFAALSQLDNGNINISDAVVSLPILPSFSTLCGAPSWNISGAAAALNLPALTNITTLYCGNGMRIQVQNGARLSAQNLSDIVAGWYETIQADGSNSLVDFSGLKTTSGGLPVTFEASGGGTNWEPQLIGGPNTYVTLNPNSYVSTAQLQTAGGITANGAAANFPILTAFDGGNITLTGGASVTIPALQNYSTLCGAPSWLVFDPGSILSLPILTNITVLFCGSGMRIQAEAGGRVSAPNLLGIVGGWTETVQADGPNSLIDFGSLRTVSGGVTVTFEASDGGINSVPQLIGGPNLYLTLNANATIPTAQIQQLGGITVNTTNISLPSVTNFDNGNVSVGAGSSLSLPNLKNYSTACGGPSWNVAGANAVLDLPALTNISAPYCGSGIRIHASAGGHIFATNLVTMDAGWYETVLADGSNSLIDFRALTNTTGGVPATFEASDGGTNSITHFLGGANAFITLNPNGTIPVAQIRQLGGITASGVTNNFPGLTNLDGGTLVINSGAAITLPALDSYSCPNNYPTWTINGAGTVLTFPALTNLLGSLCCGFAINAQAGAQLMLSKLTTIQNGYVAFTSDGAGTVIDLSQLSGFVISIGQGQITAQNGGAFLFNIQAFLLSNVAINIPPGNPVLPATLIPSQALTLYGTPWHSYLVQERNTLIPNSPWQSFYVPLTNSLQVFAPAPPANTAFQVTELIADPSLLQFTATPDDQTQIVLYGLTNGSYQIQSTTNLNRPIVWTPGPTISMTNAFRFLPEKPATNAMQFYRTVKQ